MKILLKLITGQSLELDVSPLKTVLELKVMAAEQCRVVGPECDHRMVFNGEVLQNDKSLSAIGITHEDEISIVFISPPLDRAVNLSAHAEQPVSKCPQCSKRFDDNERLPHTLACGSCVCSSCLSLLYGRAVNKRTVVCPESDCHMRTIVSAIESKDGEVLPVDTALVSAVNSGVFDESSHEVLMCGECNEQVATKFCPDCPGNMCEDCCEDNHKSKILRQHLPHIVDIDSSSSLSKIPPFCPEHRLPMKLCCKTCDGVLVCEVCSHVHGSHADHMVEAVDVSALRNRTEIEGVIEAVELLEKKSKSFSHGIGEIFRSLVGEGDGEIEESEPGSGIFKALQIIHAFFDRIRVAVTTRENELLEMVTKEGNFRRLALHTNQSEAISVISRARTALAIAARFLQESDHMPTSREGLLSVLDGLKAASNQIVPTLDAFLLPEIDVELPSTLEETLLSCGSVLTVEDKRKSELSRQFLLISFRRRGATRSRS